MNHPEKSQPPLYEVSNYAMEHFGEFLELVAWAGKEFGAIQVKVPSQEEDSSWWKRNLDGSITKHKFHTRKQTLAPTGPLDSQSFLLPTVPFTRHHKNTCFTNWATALESKEGWKEMDSLEYWQRELDGQGKKNKPYRVDADGTVPISLTTASMVL